MFISGLMVYYSLVVEAEADGTLFDEAKDGFWLDERYTGSVPYFAFLAGGGVYLASFATLSIPEGDVLGTGLFLSVGTFLVAMGIIMAVMTSLERNIQVGRTGVVHSTKALGGLFRTEEWIPVDTITSISVPEGGGPGRVLITYKRDGSEAHLAWYQGHHDILPLMQALHTLAPDRCDETIASLLEDPVAGRSAPELDRRRKVPWSISYEPVFVMVVVPVVLVILLQMLRVMLELDTGRLTTVLDVGLVTGLSAAMTGFLLIVLISDQRMNIRGMARSAAVSEDGGSIAYDVP